MDQAQAPQTAAPAAAQAPAAPAPQAAPPAAPPAPWSLNPAYPGANPPITPGQAMEAFPGYAQDALDEAGVPQSAAVKVEAGKPGVVTVANETEVHRSPSPGASNTTTLTAKPTSTTELVAQTKTDTKKGTNSSVEMKAGDKNQGARGKLDDKGNVILEAHSKTDNGDGGAIRATHGEGGTAVALEGQDDGLSTRTEVAVDPDGNPSGAVNVNYTSDQIRAGLNAKVDPNNPTVAADLKAQAELTEKLRLQAELNAKLSKDEQEATVGLGLSYKPHETVEFGVGVNAGVHREGETTQPVITGQGNMTVTPGATAKPPSP